jgi:sugar lactone lactonase YvrE
MTLRRFTGLTTLKKTTLAILASIILCIVVAMSCSPWATDGPRELRHVSTVAGAEGELGEPFGVVEHEGTIYISDGEKDCIWRLDPSGLTLVASGLDTPSAIAVDQNGNLLVADSGSHTIRSVDGSGKIAVIAGSPGLSGANDGPAEAASFNAPIGVAAANGRIYVADTYNDRIRVIVNGSVSTLAGSGRGFSDGVGKEVKFDTPSGVAVWQDKLLVADTGNGRIRVVETDGRVWTLAGSGNDLSDGLIGTAGLYQPTSIAVDSGGSIYFTDGNTVRRIDPLPLAYVRTMTSERRGVQDGPAPRARFNRPSGIAAAAGGSLLVADSENGLVRRFTATEAGTGINREQIVSLRGDPAAFRSAAPPRWPYDPPEMPRDVAGTLGEIRGEIADEGGQVWFHNGLDITGAYGETARFIRNEKVLRPLAAENFGTLRELLRMPTLGYIHIRVGRDQASKPYEDQRFQFHRDPMGKLTDVRIPRGTRFTAGEPMGTLNAMNHVHLIAGRSGYEMNALDALVLPGLADTRPPTIEKVTLAEENWREIETDGKKSRITLTGRVRVIMRAYDQADGNSDRRRLGLYRLGYQIFPNGSKPDDKINWTISFDRLPGPDAVRLVYADGSRSGATGITTFNYIVTNTADGEHASEGFIDTGTLEIGIYTLRVYAADYFGNTSSRDITFEVLK